jgi:hypothetical protein
VKDSFPPRFALTVRPTEGGYQILAGHHRKLAAEQAKLEAAPCCIVEMDDEQASLELVRSNRQSELAHAPPRRNPRRRLLALADVGRAPARGGLDGGNHPLACRPAQGRARAAGLGRSATDRRLHHGRHLPPRRRGAHGQDRGRGFRQDRARRVPARGAGLLYRSAAVRSRGRSPNTVSRPIGCAPAT